MKNNLVRWILSIISYKIVFTIVFAIVVMLGELFTDSIIIISIANGFAGLIGMAVAFRFLIKKTIKSLNILTILVYSISVILLTPLAIKGEKVEVWGNISGIAIFHVFTYLGLKEKEKSTRVD